MLILFGEFHNLPSHYDWIFWGIYFGLLLLLVCPITSFLLRGWEGRKDEITDSLSEEARRTYLQAFHASCLKQNNAVASFEDFYKKEFGRASFILPVFLCVSLAALLLYLCKETLVAWLNPDGGRHPILPAQIVLAILGGYTWVASSIVSTAFRIDVAPRDFYWATFRLVISAPMAFALTSVMKSLNADESATLAASYLLGSFPTDTVMMLARRAGGSLLRFTDAPSSQLAQLQLLPGIDIRIEEKFVAEGVSTIEQLATADPIKLTIATGLPFNFIVSCVGDALLWVYVDEQFKLFRKYGIAGAYDCSNLQEDLDSKKQSYKDDATDVVKGLAKELNSSESGIRTLVWNVANDPNTLFIAHAWASAGEVKIKPAQVP